MASRRRLPRMRLGRYQSEQWLKRPRGTVAAFDPDLERKDIRQAFAYAAWLTREEIVSA
jgi:hypothetical protein